MPPRKTRARKALPRRLYDSCWSWSPQVKQGVIGAVALLSVAIVGWFLKASHSQSAHIYGTNVHNSALVVGHSNTIVVDNSTRLAATNAVPKPPMLTLETLEGLPPQFANSLHLKLHRLTIRNQSEAPIGALATRLQLPEPICQTLETNATPGTFIGWRPLIEDFLVKGTGGKTEGGLWVGPTSAVYFVSPPIALAPRPDRSQKLSLSRRGDVTGVWELTVNQLPPGGHVSLMFLTSIAADATNYMALASEPLWKSGPNPEHTPDPNELRYFFEGEFRFSTAEKVVSQYFLAPIGFDPSTRSASLLSTQQSDGTWNVVYLDFQ